MLLYIEVYTQYFVQYSTEFTSQRGRVLFIKCFSSGMLPSSVVLWHYTVCSEKMCGGDS